MTNDVDILKCDFAADVVPYMYGEMSPTGSFAFESHLVDCEECTDELAAVSFARYEVYDWKKLEFDPLPTPRMLPFGDAVHETEKATWFDGLRAAFGGWLVPGSAFAAIAIAIAIVYGVASVSPDATVDHIANQVNRPTVIADPIPSPEVEVPSVAKITAEPGGPASAPIRTVARQGSVPRRSVPTLKTTVPRQVRTVAKTPPTLNEFTDDEDTSLRLAMLFEDLDTRD